MAMQVEQFVMAYGVEHDRLRALLPEGYTSLRPVLRINAEIRDGRRAYVEPNDAFAQYFIGQSYLAPVSTAQVGIFNVTFEPGCRNNWHVHHAAQGGGQILICIAGRGYYQEDGQPARKLHPGDVVNIPAGVKHWHGAAPNSWFSHLAVEVPGVETSNEWLEPVTDEVYSKLK